MGGNNTRATAADAPTQSGRTDGAASPDVQSSVPFVRSVRLDLGAVSDVGRVRKSNQDGYVVCRISRALDRLLSNLPESALPARSDEAGHVLMVADGMGGVAGGELASSTALISAIRQIQAAPRWALRLDDPATREQEIQRMWERGRGYLAGIHAAVKERAAANPELAGMGTTFTSAFTVGTDLFLMHVGDSRAYVAGEGQIQRLTRDHTLAQQYVDIGVFEASDPAVRRYRHVLTKAVGGPQDELQADLHALRVRVGDRLLLCTDGLTNDVTDEELAELLARPISSQAVCDAMLALALERGAKDNVTAVVATYLEESAAISR
jgi:serine/threonine protein phosphatase PrpC